MYKFNPLSNRFNYHVGVSSVVTNTTNVSNTVAETTIFTGENAADSLKAKRVFSLICSGIISNDSASDDITINFYVGSTQIASYNPAIGNVSNADWHIDQLLTVRSIGSTGSIAIHGHTEIDGNSVSNNSIETIDTTLAQDIILKVQWDNQKAGNIISIYQGFINWGN